MVRSSRWIYLLVTTFAVYASLGVVFGAGSLTTTLEKLAWWWWVAAPASALLSHIVLLQRWNTYLKELGFRLSCHESFSIYTAGLALIAAPGRSGEALRGVWLKRRHGIPLQAGVSITLAERLTDLAGAVLILSWGLGERVWMAMVIGFIVLASGGWLLTHPQLVKKLETQLEQLPFHPRWHGFLRLLREALLAIAQLRTLMRPKPLLLGTALASLCWIVESWVLQGVYSTLGSTLSLPETAVIRTGTGLGGVLSLLPAGLGTSEATSIGLALSYGVDRDNALAATVVFRFATLVVPCALGMIALLAQRDLKRG